MTIIEHTIGGSVAVETTDRSLDVLADSICPERRESHFRDRCPVCRERSDYEYLIWVSSTNFLKPGLMAIWCAGHIGCLSRLKNAWEAEYRAAHEYDWMAYC